MKNQLRILLAESDCAFAAGLRNNLELEGYQVEHVENGSEVVEATHRIDPAVLILDLSLPIVDGFDVLRRLRGAGATLPAIVLSARTDEVDRVAALKLGADDYVTKPFFLLELLERLKIHLRRTAAGASQISEISIGNSVVNLNIRTVTRGARQVKLGPKEFQLLEVLRRAGGSVVTKQQLLREVWGFECEIDTRRVDFQVGALREKFSRCPSRTLTRPRYRPHSIQDNIIYHGTSGVTRAHGRGRSCQRKHSAARGR